MSLVDCQLPGFSILESFLSGPSYIDSPLHSMVFEQEALTATQSEELESSFARHFSEPAPTLLSAPAIEASALEIKSKKRRGPDTEGDDSFNSAHRMKIQRRDYKDTEFSKPRGFEPARAMSLQETPTQSFLHPGGKHGEAHVYPSPVVSMPASSPAASYLDLNAIRRHSIPGTSSHLGTPSSTSEPFRSVWPTPFPSVYSDSPINMQGEFTANPWPAPSYSGSFEPPPTNYLSPIPVQHDFEGLRSSHHKHTHSLPITTDAYHSALLSHEPHEEYPISMVNTERFSTSGTTSGSHVATTTSADFTPVRPAIHSGLRKFPSSNLGSHRRFPCNEPGCDGKRSFGTQSNLTRHLKEQHSGVEQKSKFHCRFCPQTFTRKHAMQAHERKGTCRGTL